MFNFIGNYTTLYCRQYCHGSESTTRTPNTLYIGLGYNQDTVSSRIVHNNVPLEKTTTNEYRQYMWSFLGTKERFHCSFSEYIMTFIVNAMCLLPGAIEKPCWRYSKT